MERQVERTWEGTRESVEACLVRAAERGQLVDVRPVQPWRGEVAVRVALVPGATPARPARRLRPRTVAALAVAGALITAGSVGLAVWAVWLAVAWLLAHAVQIVGAVAGVLVVWALLGMAGKCPGIHCPGCGCS